MVDQAFEVIGPGHGQQGLGGDLAGFGAGQCGVFVQVLQHEHELVAADAGHRVGLAHHPAQPAADLLQQQVARMVAVFVVDVLEVVHVHEEQGAVLAVASCQRQGALQAFEQQAAVGQGGERVVEGDAADLFLLQLALGDVIHGRHIVRHGAVGIAHRGDRGPQGHEVAALALVPDLAFPLARLAHALPHGLVEGRVVPARAQGAGLAADHFFPAVAHQVHEGLVHPQDHGARIAHQHGLA